MNGTYNALCPNTGRLNIESCVDLANSTDANIGTKSAVTSFIKTLMICTLGCSNAVSRIQYTGPSALQPWANT